jgi:hypothetical protein
MFLVKGETTLKSENSVSDFQNKNNLFQKTIIYHDCFFTAESIVTTFNNNSTP